MGYVELFESQDPQAAACEFVYRGRTHPSDAHHYDVVSLSGRHFIRCPVNTLVPLCALLFPAVIAIYAGPRDLLGRLGARAVAHTVGIGAWSPVSSCQLRIRAAISRTRSR